MKGQSQFLTTPVPARPLNFNLSLDEPNYGEEDITMQRLEDSDSKLVEMLASQARLNHDASTAGEDAVVADKSLSDAEKRETLQGMFTMAASNGEVERVKGFLAGPAKSGIEV